MNSLTITINGKSHTLRKRELSFEQLIELAFPETHIGHGESFAIQYGRDGSGILLPNEGIEIHEGMVFDVMDKLLPRE